MILTIPDDTFVSLVKPGQLLNLTNLFFTKTKANSIQMSYLLKKDDKFSTGVESQTFPTNHCSISLGVLHISFTFILQISTRHTLSAIKYCSQRRIGFQAICSAALDIFI